MRGKLAKRVAAGVDIHLLGRKCKYLAGSMAVDLRIVPHEEEEKE